MGRAISFFLGNLLFSQQAELSLNVELIIVFLLLLLLSLLRPCYSKYIIFVICGYLWFYAYNQININTIQQKFYNTKFNVIGVIEEISSKKHKTDIILRTKQPFIAKLKLALYENKNNDNLPIKVGEKWQFNIKLKTPNTYFNEGNFDYEKYLFSNNINGVGYITNSTQPKFIAKTKEHPLNQLRENIANNLDNLAINTKFIGIIKAITIGDKSAITKSHEEILIKTNTSHLAVISGLHIGMIVGFGFIISTLFFAKLTMINQVPLKIVASIVGITLAAIYTLLAGFSIPTIRAFIMVLVFLGGIIMRNHYNRWQLYAIALFSIILVNPNAILTISFYLSFFTVAVIIYFAHNFMLANTFIAKLNKLIIMQFIISALSIPLSIYFFGFFSLSSVVANLVAIPVFSLITVPFSLIATLLSMVNIDYIAIILFELVNYSLDYLFNFLSILAKISILNVNYATANVWLIILFVIILLILFSQPQLKLIGFAILLSVSVLLQQVHNNHLHILDVGQGLAVTMTTNDEAIILDTGDKFISGFSLAENVIVPFLNNKNVDKVTTLIISHEDRDHSGGKDDLINHYQIKDIITSPNCNDKKFNFFDNTVEILSTDNKFIGNNSSCVVKISSPKLTILFTGDIEKKAEHYLINKYQEQLQADILIVPHHGSKTSSSNEFLTTVKPKIAVISAGLENRYNHPHRETVNRYNALGVKILTTQCSGQISIDLTEGTIYELRKQNAKYYHRKCNKKQNIL